jgi:DNA topoisomerase-3
VIEYPRSYGCSGYREGCKFAIWKEIAKKKITAKQASDLLVKGKTGELKGFKSKAGKDFQAILVLGADGKVGFDFGK